jgi:hypothetical protein
MLLMLFTQKASKFDFKWAHLVRKNERERERERGSQHLISYQHLVLRFLRILRFLRQREGKNSYFQKNDAQRFTKEYFKM